METKTDAAEVSEIFNGFFISTASEIGHNEDIASVPQAIDEYADHPSVMMIKRHYDNVIENFDFHSVDANDVMIILKNINPTKATGYDPLSIQRFYEWFVSIHSKLQVV